MYRAPDPHEMWDTWLFRDGKDYHLFYLQYDPEYGWNTLGRAVSKDLLHWTALPKVVTQGPEGAWDYDQVLGLLTGCTVKHQGRYYMFYGGAGNGQKIGLMTSDDLLNWQKDPANPLLTIRPPYAGWAWRDLGAVYDPKEKLWHAYVCSQTGPQEPRLHTIRDKTLVAWVYPADNRQSGGGVLTLDYGPFHSDVYDSIVLGERETGKWMAGSNITGGPRNRTETDQSANPPEAAGPGELVQIAVVYAGHHVTVYRNGERYTDYEIAEPASFGDGSAVLMGLRNIGADKGNPNSFFAGAIEEARIYDLPLDAHAISSLSPNRLSDPKPVAQWTFEDGTARDSMGTFPLARLCGGASIADGKLHLDGVDDYLTTGNDGATPLKQPLGSVAHLTSTDLVHWEYHSPVFTSDVYLEPEVPDYFEMGGRHYLIINAGGVIYYVMGDHRDGPYRSPRNPVLLGPSPGRSSHNYVGRTIPYHGGRLFYHQTMVGKVLWGTPKLIAKNPDGTLWLRYWRGLDKLVTRLLIDRTEHIALDDHSGSATWTRSRGSVVGESVAKEPSILWLSEPASDALVRFRVAVGKGAVAGLVFRSAEGKGAAVTLDERADAVGFHRLSLEGTTPSLELVDDYQEAARDYQGRKISEGVQDVRVLIRAHRAEVYLNDRLVLAMSMPDAPAKGRLGLLVSSGRAAFSRPRICEIEPLMPGTSKE